MRATWGFVLLAAGAAACQFNEGGGGRDGGSAGQSGSGSGSGGRKPGPPGDGSGGIGAGEAGAAGSLPDGATTCVPGVQGALIADCGYPAASSNPLSSVA